MAENDGQWNTLCGAQFSLPQVHVRATNGGSLDFDQDSSGLQSLWNGYISDFQGLLECHNTRCTTGLRYGTHMSSSSEFPTPRGTRCATLLSLYDPPNSTTSVAAGSSCRLKARERSGTWRTG